jgi:hypothetical protein
LERTTQCLKIKAWASSVEDEDGLPDDDECLLTSLKLGSDGLANFKMRFEYF